MKITGMKITELDAATLPAAAHVIPEDAPVVMLNLVRYKAQADYGDQANAPCSGKEAYLMRYAPAFNQVAAAEGVTGVQVLYLGAVTATLVGAEDEQWDDIVLVRYPSFAAFRAVVESPKYASDAAPHRKAALEDWRLLATSQIQLPG